MEWRGTVAGTESSFTPLLTTVQLAPLLGTAFPDLQLMPFPVDIDARIEIFKTGVSSDPAQAGSIPVRLR